MSLNGHCSCPFARSAEYYVKVMKKVQEKGGEFVKSEKERIGRILSESLDYCI